MDADLNGVLAAAVTPRRDSGHEIDLAAALDVIDYLSGSGVHGIALLGTTGEFLHFDHEERTRYTAYVVKRTELPVIANVSHSTLDGALQLAASAADAGAAAVLLMPPYFFRYSQPELERFYLEFVEELDRSVPVVIYNIPFFTTPIQAQTACRLLATGKFAGIKDSSGEWEYFDQLRRQRSETPFRILAGNDVIFTMARRAGADGVVSGVACVAPELLLALDRAILAGESDRIRRLEDLLQSFISRIDRFPAPVGVREGLRLRGVKIGPHAVPLGEALEQELAGFGEWFPGWLREIKRED